MLGPLCCPLIPSLLDAMLQAEGCGIGVDVPVAQPYELSGADVLCSSMSSLLSAVNAQATKLVPIMLVADDQILPAPSLDSLRRSANIASQWALHTGQQYHVATPDKTAVLLFGRESLLSEYTQHAVVLSGAHVPGTLVKKWVGITWDNNLSFD